MLTVKPMSFRPMLSGSLTYMTMVEPEGKTKSVVARCAVSVNPRLLAAITGAVTYCRSVVKSSAFYCYSVEYICPMDFAVLVQRLG